MTTPDDDLIERVAARVDPDALNPEAWCPGEGKEALRLIYRDHARELARWYIEAMREPTEAMWGGLARQLVMWDRFRSPTGTALYQHLRSSGRDIPAWLLEEIPDTNHVPPKGTVAACIFKAMIDAALNPAPAKPDGDA